MQHVAVLGAGSWGTALAIHLAQQGYEVRLWARNPEHVDSLSSHRENRRYLPGIKLESTIVPTTELDWAVNSALAVVVAVPSHAVRQTVRSIKSMLTPQTVIINTAKGLEENTLLRLSQVIAQEAGGLGEVAVLSGPSHAEEVSRFLPTAIVAASTKRKVAEFVQDLFMSPHFRVYTNPDVCGVEIGGALKNVIALATGIADGLGFGDNTRAALMTRGLTEIARLGVCLKAEPLTFAGLTGIGDLIVTCSSMHSRNRRAGMQLGQGIPLEQVLENMGMVVEGVKTTKAAMSLARKLGVEMPITAEIYNVLFSGKEPLQSVTDLMQRQKTHEVEEVVHGSRIW